MIKNQGMMVKFVKSIINQVILQLKDKEHNFRVLIPFFHFLLIMAEMYYERKNAFSLFVKSINAHAEKATLIGIY
jgi:hypothetical protein